jgi:predicted O-methyltransferase YrrM
MTEGVEDENGIPFRNEDDEIAATIALIKLAITAVGKPVYLVIGNDLGASAIMVLDRLNSDGEANLVDGFIQIDRVVDKPLLGAAITAQKSANLE